MHQVDSSSSCKSQIKGGQVEQKNGLKNFNWSYVAKTSPPQSPSRCSTWLLTICVNSGDHQLHHIHILLFKNLKILKYWYTMSTSIPSSIDSILNRVRRFRTNLDNSFDSDDDKGNNIFNQSSFGQNSNTEFSQLNELSLLNLNLIDTNITNKAPITNHHYLHPPLLMIPTHTKMIKSVTKTNY